jgi:glycosyltransferase involved in cell wall biosynthesis
VDKDRKIPLITIVIPAHNAAKTLAECLDSVTSSGSDRIECVIINDGSTDDTAKIAEKCASKSRQIAILNQENMGVSAGRMAGVKAANGKYIFFLDADDYIAADIWPDLLEKAASDYDIIAYGYYSLFRDSVKEERFPEGTTGEVGREEMARILMTTTLFNTCWGKLLKRSVIESNGITFPPMKTCEDAIFMLDFASAAKSALIIPKPAVYYRINPDGAMGSAIMSAKLADFAVLAKHRRKWLSENPGVCPESMLWRESFSVITDLMLKRAASSKPGTADEYRAVLDMPFVREIIGNVDKSSLPSYKKLEHRLMSSGKYGALALYFKVKSLLMKH